MLALLGSKLLNELLDKSSNRKICFQLSRKRCHRIAPSVPLKCHSIPPKTPSVPLKVPKRVQQHIKDNSVPLTGFSDPPTPTEVQCSVPSKVNKFHQVALGSNSVQPNDIFVSSIVVRWHWHVTPRTFLYSGFTMRNWLNINAVSIYVNIHTL